VPEAVAANRWLSEVHDPAVAAIPVNLRDRLDEVEIFHEILEHRWFLSEQAGRDIGTTAARTDYFARVLPKVPDDLTITVEAAHRTRGPDPPAEPGALTPGPGPPDPDELGAELPVRTDPVPAPETA
jgi:hypothetical protein